MTTPPPQPDGPTGPAPQTGYPHTGYPPPGPTGYPAPGGQWASYSPGGPPTGGWAPPPQRGSSTRLWIILATVLVVLAGVATVLIVTLSDDDDSAAPGSQTGNQSGTQSDGGPGAPPGASSNPGYLEGAWLGKPVIDELDGQLLSSTGAPLSVGDSLPDEIWIFSVASCPSETSCYLELSTDVAELTPVTLTLDADAGEFTGTTHRAFWCDETQTTEVLADVAVTVSYAPQTPAENVAERVTTIGDACGPGTELYVVETVHLSR